MAIRKKTCYTFLNTQELYCTGPHVLDDTLNSIYIFIFKEFIHYSSNLAYAINLHNTLFDYNG